MGKEPEDVIRQVIQAYSGAGPLKVERLIPTDETGEFRQPGAQSVGESAKFVIDSVARSAINFAALAESL
jgi:hypothetical protein